ncbi:copper chaperone PCu(A)C [Vibrio sp. ZSDE26]|uniref:Copper chaperone PCu(A)C n=1 Tax=Vibrio amylolyticus TaxID=2847292 RepID=A0A9X1XKW5_9VIBR|nr:copper chaperone PCu(A)C [Vibrio amylolyticus]MCK6264326.1 copper chaperone PCu(A)C [Vibrio amylolyticus]
MKLKSLLLCSLMASPLSYASTDSDSTTTNHVATIDMAVMAHHPYARATAPGAVNSAVFVHLMNHNKTDRVLVSASSSVAKNVELHDVIKEGDMMKMRQVQEITIPADGMVELKPGSLHIMLFDLEKPLIEGETIDLELSFKNGEKYSFTAPIKKVMAGMKHH